MINNAVTKGYCIHLLQQEANPQMFQVMKRYMLHCELLK